ncbi:MAG: NfeD family protein, partial [Armatimonadetes bacterium]|nr:NfeD family protein [Armatimonadota bacterium]
MSGPTWLWLLVALILGVVEVATGTVMALLFAVAALITALTAQLGFGLQAQLGVFLAGSLAVLAAAPALVRRINRLDRRSERFGPDALIDQLGVVTQPIDPIEGTGAIRVGGAVWRATANEPVAAGRQV